MCGCNECSGCVGCWCVFVCDVGEFCGDVWFDEGFFWLLLLCGVWLCEWLVVCGDDLCGKWWIECVVLDWLDCDWMVVEECGVWVDCLYVCVDVRMYFCDEDDW